MSQRVAMLQMAAVSQREPSRQPQHIPETAADAPSSLQAQRPPAESGGKAPVPRRMQIPPSRTAAAISAKAAANGQALPLGKSNTGRESGKISRKPSLDDRKPLLAQGSVRAAETRAVIDRARPSRPNAEAASSASGADAARGSASDTSCGWWFPRWAVSGGIGAAADQAEPISRDRADVPLSGNGADGGSCSKAVPAEENKGLRGLLKFWQ